MNKFLIMFLFVVFPLGLWSADEEATADEKRALPCLKVSSGCRKLIKDNKSTPITSTQQCIDDVLQGKEIKGLDVSKEAIADCKKVRSQLRTK